MSDDKKRGILHFSVKNDTINLIIIRWGHCEKGIFPGRTE